MSLFSCNWQTNSWWGSKIILPSSRKHMAWFSTGRVQTGGVGRSHAVNPYSHMSFLQHEEDEEEQGGIRPKILSGLKCYFWGQFEQFYPPPPPPNTHTDRHTKEKATDLRKKTKKNGTLTIKDGITQMHIAGDDGTRTSEIVGCSEFEYAASNYSPKSAQLSLHMMDRRGKLKILDPTGK